MKVNRVILRDKIDTEFADLLIFKHDYDFEKIEKVVQDAKTEDNEYNFDTIIKEIYKNFEILAEIDLYSALTIEY